MKILVFGAHPDDVELSIGGIIARHADQGHELHICDLTAGEMGSNGTPAQRLEEGRRAAVILGAAERHNLGLPDGFLTPDKDSLLKTAALVRQVAPDIVLAPYWVDKHPDHEAASLIATRASHLAGLHKFPAAGSRHRPGRIFYYFLARAGQPSFLVNVDQWWEQKMAAIMAHASQFAPRETGANPTYLNQQEFFRDYELRFRQWGREIGCRYAEALVTPDRIKVTDLTEI